MATARQKAASRRNLEKARKKRRRRRIAAGVATGVALAGGAAYLAHKKGYRAQVSHSKSRKKTKRISAHRSSQHVAVRGRVGRHNVAVGVLRPKKRKTSKKKVKHLTHAQVYSAYAKQRR
jgi:hypothetical protein